MYQISHLLRSVRHNIGMMNETLLWTFRESLQNRPCLLPPLPFSSSPYIIIIVSHLITIPEVATVFVNCLETLELSLCSTRCTI
jgi:hypothetical protein